MKRYRIGIVPCMFHRDPNRTRYNGRPLFFIEQSMGRWLADYGFTPYVLVIPGDDISSTLDALEDLDGLVVPGGVDVAPPTYGEKPLRPEWEGDAYRDRYETQIIKRAYELNLPTLGICRGHQIINVSFGGSLYQDITTQVDTDFEHRRADLYELNRHSIVFEPGSVLSSIYDDIGEAEVNSVHHQSVKNVAPGFVVEARSKSDDVVEAIRHADPERYVVGVQWHPEFQDPEDRTLLATRPLLDDFRRAIERSRASTSEP